MNMGFYNETYEKVHAFEEIIKKESLGKNIELGTIVLETLTIKKQL